MRKRLLAGGALVAAALTAGAIGATGAAAPSTDSARGAPASASASAVPEPVATATPEEFGAAGDGRTDDAAALQDALDALRPGGELVLRRGATYAHSRVLHVRTEGVHLHGRAVLLATDEQASALRVEADGVRIEDVVLDVARTSRRWSRPDQHKLVISAQDVVVDDVEVRGSAAAGIFVHGAEDFVLEDVEVRDTRADGVHVTGGSARGRITGASTRDTGDDGIGIVSYGRSSQNSDIRIDGAVIRGTRGGRGIAVVGGRDIDIQDVVVQDTNAAALLVATEGEPYNSGDTENVTVRRAQLVRANYNDEIDHGAVLLRAGRRGSALEDVLLEDVHITDTRKTAFRQVNVLDGRGETDGVVLRDVVVTGGGRAFRSEIDEDRVVLEDWSVDGEQLPDGPR